LQRLADAASSSGTPAGCAAFTSTIDTPDMLPPIRPAVTYSEARSLPSNSTPASDDASESALAFQPSEGIASRRCKARGGSPTVQTECGQSTGTAAPAAPGRSEPSREGAESQPEEPPSKAVLQERVETMFLRGNGRPCASGGGVLMTRASQRLVLDASEVISAFDVLRPEVQEACGRKLDAREALAYLVCDVLLGARIPSEYARKIGDRLGKLLARLWRSRLAAQKERTSLRRARRPAFEAQPRLRAQAARAHQRGRPHSRRVRTHARQDRPALVVGVRGGVCTAASAATAAATATHSTRVVVPASKLPSRPVQAAAATSAASARASGARLAPAHAPRGQEEGTDTRDAEAQ